MKESAEELFLQALELPECERQAFVVAACGQDDALRREVESLLEDSRGAGAIFENPPVCAGISVDGGFTGEKAGEVIGNYRLLEIIGEGGFAVVWKAEQSAPIQRIVAVKILKAGMDTREVLARFDAERQALARMDHPNIARVFDAGATPSGRPYFAMEWVDGTPITKFCEAATLGIRERIELFMDICAAVGHAHQKGVIHRDLKPGNVLVKTDGNRRVVKVIDFGIAKAIEGRLADRTLHTRLEQVLGTPVYMSPEQAGLRGLDVDTRSDIYSLGVLLYELLAGVPPFDSKTLIQAGYDEMRRIVREVEPPRPSTRLHSMGTDEVGRIASARQISPFKVKDMIPSDLDWIVMKALEKPRERRYPTTDAFVEDMRRLLADEPVSARPPSAWYLLGKFARRHAAGLLVAGGVAVLMVAAVVFSSWQAARAMRAEALAMERLREATRAKAMETQAREDAEAVARFFREIFELPDPDTNGRDVKIADALDAAAQKIETQFANQPERRALFEKTLGGTYAKLGLYPPAIQYLRKALQSYAQIGETDSSSVVQIRGDLTGFLSLLGYYEEAAESGTNYIELLKKTEPETSETVQDAITARNKNWFASGRRQEAIAAQTALVATLENDLGGSHRQTLAAKSDLNMLRRRAGLEPDAALPQNRPPPPPAPDPGELKQKKEARIRELEEEWNSLREEYGADSVRALETQTQLARALGMTERREEGTKLMRDILERLTAKYGETHSRVLDAQSQWAFFLWRTRQGPAAREEMRKSLQKRKEIFGPLHLQTLIDQAAFADALSTQKVYLEEATTYAAEAVDGLRKVSGKSRELHHAMGILARCLMAGGQWWEAMELVEECAPNMADDTFVNRQLAELQVWFGRLDEYEETRRRMIHATPWTWRHAEDRPDVYDRTALLACLAPFKSNEQAEAVRALLNRAEEIRSTPNIAITRADPELAAIARCLFAYREGNDAAVQSAYEDCLRIAGERKSVSSKPLVVDFIQAMSLARRGKNAEARGLYSAVTEGVGPLPEGDSRAPHTGNPHRILLRIFQREASKKFAPLD